MGSFRPRTASATGSPRNNDFSGVVPEKNQQENSMFIKTISHLNKGGTISELDENLAELVRQIRATGKPGSLTLKLTVKPIDSEAKTIEVKDKITLSVPDIPRRSSVFYTNEDGRVSRTDPEQPELPIQAVDGGLEEEAPAIKPTAAAV